MRLSPLLVLGMRRRHRLGRSGDFHKWLVRLRLMVPTSCVGHGPECGILADLGLIACLADLSHALRDLSHTAEVAVRTCPSGPLAKVHASCRHGWTMACTLAVRGGPRMPFCKKRGFRVEVGSKLKSGGCCRKRTMVRFRKSVRRKAGVFVGWWSVGGVGSL